MLRAFYCEISYTFSETKPQLTSNLVFRYFSIENWIWNHGQIPKLQYLWYHASKYFPGLDPSGFRQSMAMRETDEEGGLFGGNQISDEEKYKDCDRFKFNCPKCGKEIIFDSALTGAVSTRIILNCLLYTRSRITRTRLYQIISYFEGHPPHQKSLNYLNVKKFTYIELK